MGLKNLKPATVIIALTGIILLIYIAFKANFGSFTHDESYSYLHYVHTPFMDIISFSDWYTNNHILNSLSMKYSERFFGTSELSLRLPNLILFMVYMLYSFLLFRNSSQVLQVSVFILLCTNNSIIDFFGLARGYGLSYGFMIMSLYHFIQSYSENKISNIILFHIGALLAVLSSFMLFDFYICLLLIHAMISFLESKYHSSGKFNFAVSIKPHILPLIINAVILYEPIRRVVMNSDLNFGGEKGFYADTVTNLIFYGLQETSLPSFGYLIAKISVTAIVLIPFFMIIQKAIRKEKDFFNNYKGLIISNSLLVFISITLVLQHVIMKTDYPISRFSVFLLPIFIISTGYIFDYFFNSYKKTTTIVLASFALASTLSFTSNIDLYSSAEWKYDSDTKNMIINLTEHHFKNNQAPDKIKLGINWLFEPTVNFYRQTNSLAWLLPADRVGISSGDDYFYIFKEDLAHLKPGSYTILYEYHRSNTLLLLNHKPGNSLVEKM